MRALVTGGAGFIGHHLVRGLLRSGADVTVIDDFSSGSRMRLQPFEDRITLVEGSILDPDAVDRAAASCEVVFHLAAVASVARSVAAPIHTNAVNVGGTIEVMLAASRRHVRRVVFAGSSAVYGTSAALPCREDQVPDPESPYGASKLAAEHYVHALGRLNHVETAVLRYFNVFGPGQDPDTEYAAVIPAFAARILEGRPPTINGSGDISRDFIYVDDVVEANLRAAGSSGPSGITCNIASGTRTSLLEVLAAINAAAGREIAPVIGPPRAGDVLHSYADVSVARQSFGYVARVPFGEGIRATIAWYRIGSEETHEGAS